MATAFLTPRDRLQRLTDLGRRAARYWWLVAVFAAVGAALALVFAVMRPKTFVSTATLSYEELIRSDVLSPGREQITQRNIGDKYRELLLARSQLADLIADPALNPFPNESDPDVAIDKLRQKVKLEARGGNTLRIVFTDSDPVRAKAVTERLTALLRAKDEWLANESARRTVEFATAENESSSKILRERELRLAQFLAAHPEFAQDTAQGSNEGASIRAIKSKAARPTADNPRLRALERQRTRIQARLSAPADQPIRISVPPSPERIAAEAAVADAQRELAAANRTLEEVLRRVTAKHPSAINAQERKASAQQRVRQAQAAVPPAVETTVAPATPQDREKLQRELAEIEQQIAKAQSASTTADQPAADASTDRVVKLETEHAGLRREVTEQRERVEALASSVFRAQMDASQRAAEQSRLVIIDPATKPVKASGPGKFVFLLAGTMLFLVLGVGLAVGLAVIDDRIFRPNDLDELGLSVLAVIPPAAVVKPRGRRSASS